MRTLLVIGIGAGDPEQITVQAIDALNRVDVFFVVDKGTEADELTKLRHDICARYATARPHRFVSITDPKRDRGADDYVGAVNKWRAARRAAWREAIEWELADGQTGAFLVWGDPSLYDATVDLVGDVPGVDVEVVPGVSSLHLLAARHKITLNRVGGAVLVTTGRRLADRGFPHDADDVVVMLDAECAFRAVTVDADIYWGAYLGTPDEILIAGPLESTVDEIVRARAEARARKGWIFDIYLLRRRT